jgi:hypothetical protein
MRLPVYRTSVTNKHKISTCLYTGGSESCTSIFDSDAYSLDQSYIVAVVWVIVALKLLRFSPVAEWSERSVNLVSTLQFSLYVTTCPYNSISL